MPESEISKTLGQVTELTFIAKLKPGTAPKLRATLAAAQKNPNPGVSKIGKIHFCRWVIFDNDTRLLFTSNFDGSWEDYIGDFSVQIPDLMDGCFNACEGYPEKGCRDFPAFRKFVRDHQIPTDLFYAAYPGASVRSVLKGLAMSKPVDGFVSQPT